MKIEAWFIFALLALITWGFWGFFPKLSTNYLSPKSAAFWEVIGGLIFGIILLIVIGFKVETNFNGALFGILTGFTALLGGFFLLLSFSKGAKISVAVVMTALYPLITILLAVLILHETLTWKKGVGILFSLAAMIFFSI